MDDGPSLSQILVVLGLVLGNGYFVAAEFAIVRARSTKLKEGPSKDSWGTKAALRLTQELDLSLSATQLGITVMSLLLGWQGEHIFAQLLLRVLSWLPEGVAVLASHSIATTLAIILITVLHVVIGELAAKSVAIRHPEMTLRILAPSMIFLSRSCRPIIFVLNGAANIVLSLFGMEAVTESERVHSTGELSMLIAHSAEAGILDKDEGEMLRGVFSFSETVAREVMTPRTDVVSIHIDTGFDELLRIVRHSRHSRFPVVGDSVDDVKGILLARDLLALLVDDRKISAETFDINKLIRSAYFIPGTKPIDDLLNELKRRNQHIVIVLDEHGGMDGIVTLEDLLEEIVGDIFDESDAPEREIVEQPNGDHLIDGGVLVSDINERFHTTIAEGDYDTVAGFIFSTLGRMAVPGDKIVLFGDHLEFATGVEVESAAPTREGRNGEEGEVCLFATHLTVESVIGNRIEWVRLHLEDRRPFEEEEGDGAKSGSLSSPRGEEEEIPQEQDAELEVNTLGPDEEEVEASGRGPVFAARATGKSTN